MLHNFKRFTIRQVPREQKSNVDALAKLATTKEVEMLNVVLIDYLASPSIVGLEEEETIQPLDSWMKPIMKYLVSIELPHDKKVAQKLLYQAHQYVIMDSKLYSRGCSLPLLRCSLPMGNGGVKHAIVAIDYFTKWFEAEPLTTITSKKVLDFVIKNIICRYRLLRKIVSDNSLQFNNALFTDFCKRHGVIKSFSSIAHPQENKQVEAVNKTLKVTLKKRFE
ncbi:uncharacterized protein LOC133833142 [Humulus lupulus]|uniref:uncharacterized protein LOC133833142 n=1 Tax=Humulus lupulus TaxID=3486 RepID=UPI002B401DC8|nr:uncharacterized protein LOC133833142 [Humulus lupulus]